MKTNKNNLLLYAVTDTRWLDENTSLENFLEKTIPFGITCVQLREKNLDTDKLIKKVISIKKITSKFNIPLIVNDNVKAAKYADGVHLGQDDMEISKAREILGDNYIIGASAHSIEEAVAAEKSGANYIGIGAVFGSKTKTNVKDMNPVLLNNIAKSVKIPSVAIGGINKENINLLKDACVSGVAVVSAIFASKNPCDDTKYLFERSKEFFGK